MVVSKKTPNNAVASRVPDSAVVVLVVDDSKEYHQALWHHIIVWRLSEINKHKKFTRLRLVMQCIWPGEDRNAMLKSREF